MRGPVFRAEHQGVLGGIELCLQAWVAFGFWHLVDGFLCEAGLGSSHHGRRPFLHCRGKGVVPFLCLHLVVDVLCDPFLQPRQDCCNGLLQPVLLALGQDVAEIRGLEECWVRGQYMALHQWCVGEHLAVAWAHGGISHFCWWWTC